ncbi:MAG: HIT family protein [Candidatus Aenigmarchaeota archaeon ex4484_14]|nr:MAG: HIT family protein [Candidatus Aenigmarchaeota archaeon ex4484_14]
MSCLFCEIQRKKNKIIAENETFIAIFDDMPVNAGHCLIIPKRHVISFFDLTAKEVKDCYELTKRVKEYVDKKFSPDAYNIGINEGRVAGRTIDHLHIHLIPRYVGDVENPTGGVRNVIPGKAD